MTNEPGAGELADEIRSARRLMVAVVFFAAACVLVGVGGMLGGRRELTVLADNNVEMTRRINKLTAESALKDARFQAAKGVTGARVDDLLAIQSILDDYAREELHNGNSAGRTYDEVRREACARLARRFPCAP